MSYFQKDNFSKSPEESILFRGATVQKGGASTNSRTFTREIANRLSDKLYLPIKNRRPVENCAITISDPFPPISIFPLKSNSS